jgi:hypothetical protein
LRAAVRKGVKPGDPVISLGLERRRCSAGFALAALASPIGAMFGTVIAALLSFGAATTAPRVQREIAQERATLTDLGR